MKIRKRYIVVIILMLIFFVYYLNLGDNNAATASYDLSELAVYDSEYNTYITKESMIRFLEKEVDVRAYVHVDESKNIYLVNVPYINNYDNLGTYGIISIPAEGYINCDDGDYIKARVQVEDDGKFLRLKIRDTHSLSEEKSTRLKEFEYFMKSKNFSTILNSIDAIDTIDKTEEADRKRNAVELLSIKESLLNNFYQGTDKIVNIIDYLVYLDANPELKDEKSVDAIRDLYILSVIDWGKC